MLQAIIMSQLQIPEDWPESARLYKPDEESQILLSENADSLTVQAYLHMSGLKVSVVQQHNAEFMSPSGGLPVLFCGNIVLSEPSPIIDFLHQREYSLNKHLNDVETIEQKAYIELIKSVFVPAELFISWALDDNIKKVTFKRYGSPYTWPLNRILCWRKQHRVLNRLNAIGWGNKQRSISNVVEEVTRCCQALSQKLGENRYYFGGKPSELDAHVFGHLYTLLTTTLPDNRFAESIRKFENLVLFCQNIDEQYFHDNSVQ